MSNRIVEWGSVGAENRIELEGQYGGHRGKVMASWEGDVECGRDGFDAEFAGIFSSLSRSIKRTVRSVVPRSVRRALKPAYRVTAKGYESLEKGVSDAAPYLAVGAGVAALAIPGAGPVIAGVTTAAVLASKVKGARKVRQQAVRVIKATLKLGKKEGKARRSNLRRVSATLRREKSRLKRFAFNPAAVNRRRKSAARLKLLRAQQAILKRPTPVERGAKTLSAVLKARKASKRSGRRVAWVVTRKGFVLQVK